MIEFAFSATPLLGIGECIYRKRDYSLEFSPVQSPKNYNEYVYSDKPDNLLIFNIDQKVYLVSDTLSLVFHGRTGKLLGLDAYTNYALWIINNDRNLPRIDDKGTIKLLGDNLEELNHSVYLQSPIFEINHLENFLHISWGKLGIKNSYQIYNNLIVSLHDKYITDLYLLNLIIKN